MILKMIAKESSWIGSCSQVAVCVDAILEEIFGKVITSNPYIILHKSNAKNYFIKFDLQILDFGNSKCNQFFL